MSLFDEAETITAKDVTDFLESKGVGSLCPQCSQEHTIPVEKPGLLVGDAVAAFYYSTGADPTEAFNYPVIPLVCPNCGYIRSFMVGAILKWRRGQSNGR